MILYRLSGRCEKWAGAGMLFTRPLIASNLTEIRKLTNKAVTKFKKENKAFKFRLQKLVVSSLEKAIIIDVLTNEDTEKLIKNIEELDRWENKHDRSLKRPRDE